MNLRNNFYMQTRQILLIDPFRNLINAYRIILEEEKYAVETASTLEEAYKILRKRESSVIITEYIPPFETTDYLIQWVKKNTPEVYIIMVTNASIDDKTYEKLFNLGIDDFILKPYSPKRILVHIKKGLKQRELIIYSRNLERLNLIEPVAHDLQTIFFNRSFFKRCLRQEIKKAKRHHRPLSLLLLQLPDTDEIGDQYNQFYMELIKIIKNSTREEDLLGKDNGDIGIILPETDQSGSKALIQRLTNLISKHPPFKTDKILATCVQSLYFQSYTYPNQFTLPKTLSPVLEGLNGEYSHN